MVLLLAGGYGVAYALSGETVPRGTTVDGVSVGGMTPVDATTALNDAFASRGDASITLQASEAAVTRTAQEFGVSLDAAASVDAVMPGKSLNPVDIWQSLMGGGEHAAVVTRDQAALDSATDELAQQVNVDPTNAAITIKDAKATLSEAAEGQTLNVTATQDALVAQYLTVDQVEAVVDTAAPDITTEEAQTALDEVATPALSAPVTLTSGGKSAEITPAMIGASLSFEPTDGALEPVLSQKTLVKKTNKAIKAFGLQEPEDAYVKLSNGKPTVVPSKDGKGVDPKELVSVVEETMVKTDDRTAAVTVTDQEAEYTTKDAENAGVKEITGEFSTEFPATAYRVNNIGKSAGLINNTYLKPGETFSMNAALGPRTLANGWMAGGAIDGGKVVERMGGGISQTTTTLFNAIFFAGLEDIYHKPHSLYFNRYPMGREATLDYYSVDMKFKNDSDHGVLIQAFTNNPSVGGTGKVTVRIWSTKEYVVKASDPVQSNFTNPGSTIKDSSSVCSPQSAKQGFTVNYNRLFYKDGKLVRTEPFQWTYNYLTPVVCTNPNATADRIER